VVNAWKIDDWLASGKTHLELVERHVVPWSQDEVFGEWPALADEALYGPAGRLIEFIEPESEAGVPGILLPFLSAFGNVIGRGAYWQVESDKHYCKINVVLVGETAKGRKGTGSNRGVDVVSGLDEAWCLNTRITGLSSGEGLIHRVRDPVWGHDRKTGEDVLVDEGVADKRLFVEEPEFAGPLNVMQREGSTLSSVLRNTWDDKALAITTRTSPEKATQTHISVLAHITKEELIMHLTTKRVGSGIGNRFLFALTKRSKRLPFGGNAVTLPLDLVEQLQDAKFFGSEHRRIEFSQEPELQYNGLSAHQIWECVYGELSEGKPGLFGAVVSRSEAYTRRLATLYAVLDCSDTVRVDHLLAGLAIWQYCEDSARIIFGNALGDEVADEIMAALEMAGERGMSRTEISDLFARNKSASSISTVLKQLEARELLVRIRESHDGPGRPPEKFYAR
jgi:hypothetical protein